MIGESGLGIREPAVAGMFYPADPADCRAQAQSFLHPAPLAGEKAWMGGIVPHAGWICSGAVAGLTISTIAASAGRVDVVVIFGAVHTPVPLERAALDNHAAWRMPGSDSTIATETARRLVEDGGLFVVDPRFHLREHAVEVELPMIQLAWPGAAVLPVEVPLVASAAQIGTATARSLRAAGLKAVYIASSDFTHYGPNYRFTPAGIGPAALEWALDNDRRLLRLITTFATGAIVGEVSSRMNACGGGAIAAMLAACGENGATQVEVLQHTNSYQTLRDVMPQTAENAVGYAAVVVG